MISKICVHGYKINDVELTDLLTALLSSVVHDDWWVDEGAGSGHILSKQAFHFVRAQTDRQIEELHWSSLGITGKGKTMTLEKCDKSWWDFVLQFWDQVSRWSFNVTTAYAPQFKWLRWMFIITVHCKRLMMLLIVKSYKFSKTIKSQLQTHEGHVHSAFRG